MKDNKTYFDFLTERGFSLAKLNPNSSEIALTVSDSLTAVELLSKLEIPILGGDILVKHDDNLLYAYQFLGDEYICLNWYCDQNQDEDKLTYIIRSHEAARASITNAEKIIGDFGLNTFIVMVIDG